MNVFVGENGAGETHPLTLLYCLPRVGRKDANPTRMWDGTKALDLVAAGPQKTGWLIEVKDYRAHQRAKPSEAAVEVAQKVFDTLAALPPA